MEIKPLHTVAHYSNDMKAWKVSMALVVDEIRFIDNLMQSYVFEPQTPNLYERLEEYKSQIFKTKTSLQHIQQLLMKLDLSLSGLKESETVAGDMFLQEKHLQTKQSFEQFMASYNKTKIPIFNYCGAVLKKIKKHGD
jgi:hypothetical protein